MYNGTSPTAKPPKGWMHMIRKLLAAALCLLLACACLSALADTLPVYCLYQDEAPVGAAVLLGDGQTLLTALDAARVTDYAVQDDSRHVPGGMTTDGYAALLHLDEVMSAAPALLSPGADDANLVCAGFDTAGQPVLEQPYLITPYRFNGHAAVVFSLSKSVLPGAVLLDSQNAVAGLVVAAYGEGVNRYVAYTNEGLYFAMMGMDGSPVSGSLVAAPAVSATVWLEQPTLTMEDSVLTVDWSACAVSDLSDDSMFTVFMQDIGNPFYTYRTVTADVTSCQFSAAPGRIYAVWVRHDHGTAVLSELPEQDDYTFFGPVPVTAFARYDYADESIWLSTVPAGEVVGDTALLPTAIALTADDLDGSHDIYLQVVSRYQVDEQSDCNLYISVVDPSGMEVGLLGGFIFAPEYMDHDVWHAPVSDLFEVLRSYRSDGRLVPGEYTISYYLYGEMANSFSFTLE